ncbi:type VI secretion system Vgr family protein, partial [Paraburkholderia silviterrae]
NHLALDDTENRQQAQLASDRGKSSLSLGYITRIEGNAGRQDARGEGFELRSDRWGALRAALGLLLTTFGREKAAGKAKDMGETHSHLTEARGIHEELAQSAQKHGAQEATDNQTDVTRAIKDANAALRGKEGGEFPEFDNPDIVISSAANVHTAAECSTHIASRENTALTAGGDVAIAAKSLFVSVRRVVSFFAYKSMSFIARELVRIESRLNGIDMTARGDITQTSTDGVIRLTARQCVEIKVENTTVRFTPQGIFTYTDGQYLVHAANHATDDPQAPPVQFPVTSENPGKLAAHHVLVESGGGFPVPNQPYRLTLDDGQIIQGVTNELGEMQMATSNVVSFGMIELLSQTNPEQIIGIAQTTVYEQADVAMPAVEVAAQRTTTVGGKTISTPPTNTTSQGKPATYMGCDPLNFGLRTYQFLSGGKADDPKYLFVGKIQYPVAKAYTKAMKSALTGMDWVGLSGKSSDAVNDAVKPVVRGAILAALQYGSFGLPVRAMPKIIVAGPDQWDDFGMKSDYNGCFHNPTWALVINKNRIDHIATNEIAISKMTDETIKKSAVFDNHARMQTISNTMYHEARHCQQKFWMLSLYHSNPSDYEKLKEFVVFQEINVAKNILLCAQTTPFPNNDLVRIGVHRMLMFDYYWTIMGNKDKSGYEFLANDQEAVEAEICKLLNVTSEVARKMADHETGYRSQLHEEDAFSCGDLVDSYWSNDKSDPDSMRNPGSCTREYLKTINAIGGGANA